MQHLVNSELQTGTSHGLRTFIHVGSQSSLFCLLKDHGDSDHIGFDWIKAFLNIRHGSKYFRYLHFGEIKCRENYLIFCALDNPINIFITSLYLSIIYGCIFSHPTHGMHICSDTNRILWLILFVVNMKEIIVCYLSKTNHTECVPDSNL